MPPERSAAAALSDMLQAAERVLRFLTDKTRPDYEREELLRHAVERNLEIIGEAARRLSPSYGDAHPEIPWRPIMATRHILAHEYDEVDIPHALTPQFISRKTHSIRAQKTP